MDNMVKMEFLMKQMERMNKLLPLMLDNPVEYEKRFNEIKEETDKAIEEMKDGI